MPHLDEESGRDADVVGRTAVDNAGECTPFTEVGECIGSSYGEL